jgi:hypothetical protein
MDSAICSKPSHPQAAYKFQDIEKIYGKCNEETMNHVSVGNGPYGSKANSMPQICGL